MQELIHFHTETPDFPINSQEFADFLGLSYRGLENYLFGRRKGFAMQRSLDFTEKKFLNANSGRPQSIYFLSIRAAKEIALAQGTEKGYTARQYFIEVETNGKPQSGFDPATIDLEQALEVALGLVKEKKRLESQLIEAREQIAIQAPAVEAFEILMDEGANIDFGAFARLVQNKNKAYKNEGRNTIMKKCRVAKILITGGQNHNLPYQEYLTAGYFATVETIKNGITCLKTLITPKGQPWLMKRLGYING